MTDRRYQPIDDPDNPWFVGDHKTIEITVYQLDSDVVENITGWNFKWEMRIDETEEEALVSKSNLDMSIPVGTDGRVLFEVTHDETADLDGGSFAHALARTDSGEEGIYAYGPAVLYKAATV